MRKVLKSFFIIIFLSIIIFSCYMIFNWIEENNKNRKIHDDTLLKIYVDESIEDVSKYSVDFDALKESNSEIIRLD